MHRIVWDIVWYEKEGQEGMEEYHDRSLRGRVFQRLREDILSGVYHEHEELREITIGEELGVSRTPVREALRQLELEGLVTIIPKIRSMLEGMCARWATEHITERQIEELEEVLLLSEFHLQKKGGEQAEQVTELDGQFHKVLYEASNSRILEHVLSDFHKYVQMARAMSVGEKNRAVRSIQEHREILEAIKDRDGELAEELANRHILNVMKNLHLSEQVVRRENREEQEEI